jgi:hypothetical protein
MQSESEEQGADWSDLRDCSVQLEKENPQANPVFGVARDNITKTKQGIWYNLCSL